MLFVVSLWMAYANLNIARIPGPASQNQLANVGAAAEENPAQPGFFAIFTAGTKIIFDALKNRVAVKHDIVINKQEVNFVAEDIEPIKGSVLK